MVHSLSRSIPSCVISVASIRACVHFRLFDVLDALIFQTLLNFEKLLRSSIIVRVTRGAHSTFPLGPLRPQEVAVNSVLNFTDCGFGALMRRICVLVPPVEARLILSIVQLTVMN